MTLGATGLILAPLALAAACGDDDDGGDGPLDANTARAQIGDESFEFEVTQCAVPLPTWTIGGELAGSDVPTTFTAQRFEGNTAVFITVNPDPVTRVPEKTLTLIDLIGEDPAVIDVNPQGFTMTASGTWTDLTQDPPPRVQGVLEVFCEPQT